MNVCKIILIDLLIKFQQSMLCLSFSLITVIFDLIYILFSGFGGAQSLHDCRWTAREKSAEIDAQP